MHEASSQLCFHQHPRRAPRNRILVLRPVFLVASSALERMIATAAPSKASAEVVLLLVALMLERLREHIGVVMYGWDDSRNGGGELGDRAGVGSIFQCRITV